MNAVLLRIELLRQVRDVANMFFVVGLPAILYTVFGSAANGQLAHGNSKMYVTISMALYGAVTATTAVGGGAAVERVQGWGRQLGLTPLTDVGLVLTKVVTGLVIAVLPVAVVYAVGALTGARATVGAWVVSAVAVVLGAALFSLFGLAVALAFPSESAVNIASGALVLLSFLGNLFTPLSGAMLEIARFTPMYGYAQLARRPLTGEWVASGTDGLVQEALWVPVLNVVAWTVVLGVLCLVLVRRIRARQ